MQPSDIIYSARPTQLNTFQCKNIVLLSNMFQTFSIPLTVTCYQRPPIKGITEHTCLLSGVINKRRKHKNSTTAIFNVDILFLGTFNIFDKIDLRNVGLTYATTQNYFVWKVFYSYCKLLCLYAEVMLLNRDYNIVYKF